VLDAADYDPRIMFATQREAMTKAITKALAQEPSIDWLLENQDSVEHYFHGLALKGEL
jgi:5,6,7,8-tetrahydromethanopterin hydro-lyase